jgi:hypothetical protein
VIDFPGVLVYVNTRQEAMAKVKALIIPIAVNKLAYSNITA